jgi:hypothetical protein
MSEIDRIALVGHCGPDAAMLKHAVQRVTGEASVELVTDDTQLQRVIQPNALLLVNRVLDGDFAVQQGVALIRELAGRDDGPRFMLVSNFDDAQAEAREAGAYPGFGKHEMGQAAMRDRLHAAMNGEGASPQTDAG